MRVTAKLWIAALMRRVSGQGGFATILHRGDDDAGAIFVIERVEGRVSCWAPVPQMMLSAGESNGERYFECALSNAGEEAVSGYIDSQIHFDPDCNIVEVDGCTADLPVTEAGRKQSLSEEIASRFGNVFKK